MTHDPYQTHLTAGYTGLNPFSSPYATMQTAGINPAIAWNPLAQQGYGISPQQLQLASALASQSAQMFGQTPFVGGWQNPFAGAGPQQGYNPYAQQYQQPYQHPYQQLGYAGSVFGQQQVSPFAQFNNPFGQQQVSPFAQFNNPFGQQNLAPQSWVGQGQQGQVGQLGGGFGGVQGQVNPLFLQAVARAIQQTQGIAPWGTF